MKKKNLFIATLLVVAATTIAVVSCKKEKNETRSQHEKTEMQSLVNRIKVFQTLCESVQSGIKADGVMSVEEMRQNLDLTANYEHSEHMTYCENTILDTLYLAMPPVDEDGNVAEMDVVATYEAFETELGKHMEMCNDGRILPSYFSIVMPEKGVRAEEGIRIVFLRGEEGQEAKGNRNTCDGDGPFNGPYDYWYWGDNLGRCKWDPYNATADATDVLSQHFGFVIPEEHLGESYFVYNVVHVNYRPCDRDVQYGYSLYYEDPNMEDCADTWLFCHITSIPVDLCIDWNELNCYWRSINRNIVDADAPLHYTYLSDHYNVPVPYHCCYISWNRFYVENDYGRLGHYYQIHVAHVTYCDVSWAENPLPPFD